MKYFCAIFLFMIAMEICGQSNTVCYSHKPSAKERLSVNDIYSICNRLIWSYPKNILYSSKNKKNGIIKLEFHNDSIADILIRKGKLIDYSWYLYKKLNPHNFVIKKTIHMHNKSINNTYYLNVNDTILLSEDAKYVIINANVLRGQRHKNK